jgi:integrase
MKITFKLRTKSPNSSIYIRVRTDINDVLVKTKFSVDSQNFERGKIKPIKIGQGVSVEVNDKIRANKQLNQVQNNLNVLENKIQDAFLKERPSESNFKDWVNEQINPTKQTPKTLSQYATLYEQLNPLKHSTTKRNKSIVNRILAYRDVELTEIDMAFKVDLILDLQHREYANNTITKTIKVLQTFCRHAYRNGFEVHPDSIRIAEGLKIEPTPIVYLTLDEIDEIKQVTLDEKLSIVRDWLIISIETGQRSSDFFRLTKKHITTENGQRYLKINQQKGGYTVKMPILEPLERILRQYNGNLPPLFTTNPESNKTTYNRLVKKVCKIAGINELTEANIKNPKTKRYEKSNIEKWRAVSSHIGRRSFATNYYGKMQTPYIMAVTGHRKESQFLEYVGETDTSLAEKAGERMRQIYKERTYLKVIHNKAN